MKGEKSAMYNTIHPELKKAIAQYLLDNPTLFNRAIQTRDAFSKYIYDREIGGYLIGGEAVKDFIMELEKLL